VALWQASFCSISSAQGIISWWAHITAFMSRLILLSVFFFNFLTSGSTKLKIGARDKEQGQQFSQAFVL
jgi:hypothetical protein